jgi:hypothetical protein
VLACGDQISDEVGLEAFNSWPGEAARKSTKNFPGECDSFDRSIQKCVYGFGVPGRIENSYSEIVGKFAG